MKNLNQGSYGAALALSALLFSGSVAAGPLDITNIVGYWDNAMGGNVVSNVDAPGQGTDEIRWGTIGGAVSGYDFTPGMDLLDVALDTPLLLGTFVHHNQAISAGTGIDSVDYKLSFMTSGVPMNLMTTLMMDHDETSNTGGGCCDDIVTVASADLESLITTTMPDELYFFSLLGFSVDGGMTFDDEFVSPEGGMNTAGLYGIVSARSSVPEPFTILLLGMGLIALGTQRRLGWNRG